MNTEFEDKTIVVTGAASGMGKAEALALAAASAKVWVADISADTGNAVVDEIVSQGGSARFYQLDVTDPKAWDGLARIIETEDGTLNGLVNNAGVSHRFGIVDTSIEDWKRVMDINLSSVFYGMKSLAPLLAKAGGGSIVNVSSIAGMMGYFAAAYGASKWGVRGLSKTGALEFAGQHIRVNSLHPGLVETPLLLSGSPQFVTESLKAVPAGRVAQVADIADTVTFLLSDKSRYITGTEIVIDGGMSSGGVYHRLMQDLTITTSAP
ncbi:MAG: NAD(P)-dependent oxidoreductase [Burkholderia sp.]|nr:NAD(P)-dependent oxidoreductase [Burkholderia sp.]